MSVDWDKPIQTKDGRPARVLGGVRVKPGNEFPVVVAVQSKYGEHELVRQCRDNGAVMHSKERIVNVPEKHVRWVNCYPPGCTYFSGNYKSREEADEFAFHPKRIACIRIDFEEGEGL